jgi:hypothetical protein
LLPRWHHRDLTEHGTADRFCFPGSTPPSVVSSLLDADRGGYFRVGGDRDDYMTKQLYVPDTALLITRFMTPDGVGEVHDLMPVANGHELDHKGRDAVVENARQGPDTSARRAGLGQVSRGSGARLVT